MRTRNADQNRVLLESGFLLKEVFADSYEYEEYFKIINSSDINDFFPSEFEVEFDEGGKAPKLQFPKDRPNVVVLVVPMAKKSSSPKKRSEARQNAFIKFGGLIPKIRLEMKDEVVMRKKLLVPENEREIIDKVVETARKNGLRRLKKSVKANRKSGPQEGQNEMP